MLDKKLDKLLELNLGKEMGSKTEFIKLAKKAEQQLIKEGKYDNYADSE